MRSIRWGGGALRARGWTVVELVTVLAVVVVLAAAAAPAFHDLIRSQRASATSSAILAHLVLARSEAIKRSGRVVLCKSSNGETCASSGGWEQGWLVFHDLNGDAELGVGEAIVAKAGPLSPGVTLRGNSPVSRYVSYDATGATRMVSGAFQAGTLTVCVRDGPSAGRQLVINAAGRVRVQRAFAGACP